MFCITILFLGVIASGQKTVGLSVKFTPEAPDSFETATGNIIRGKFPVIGSRITLGIEYIDLPADKGLDDSLIVELLANFFINDVAAILRLAFKI